MTSPVVSRAENAGPAFVMSVDFDAEELWIAEDPENASRPGALSQAAYGADIATPLLIDLFVRLDLPATFFVCGGDAERHPDRVRAIADAGFEIGHHGMTHRSPSRMSREEEERELVAGLDILRRFSPDIVGYRSPSWDFSPDSLDLLEEHGFEYSSNLMSAIHPFPHKERRLTELPVHWILDDAPHFWFDTSSWDKTVRGTDEVLQIWTSEAEAIWDLGGTVTLTVHPHIIGRPSRLRMLEAFLLTVFARVDVVRLAAREAARRIPLEVAR